MNRLPAVMGCLACLLLAACPSTTTRVSTTPTQVIAASAGEGVLGPLDLLEVRVFGEEELTGEYQVEVDGTLNFPLIGSVNVAGLTPTEASRDVATRLEDGYLNNADVTIRVMEANSRQIVVLGKVKEPGSYPYIDGMTVVQAIAQAGGLDEDHAANRTTITRIEGDHQVIIRVRFGDVSRGKAPNVILRPKDTVLVPESPI